MATRKTNVTGEEQAAEAAAPAAGGVTGLAAGAGIGAAVGGPVGAAVGAAVGGPIGAAIGSAASWDEAEPEFRRHYESGPYKSISSWETVSPAYRYGFETASRDEYRDKSYDEISSKLRKGYTLSGKYDDYEPMIRTAYEARRGRQSSGTYSRMGTGEREAVIPVVEEELKVGKRKVSKGGVKVETSVTEVPVEESVQLHEEHVNVKRRPANRELRPGDAAFKEGTIEMTETAEEAVVQKRARVIEEVVISKVGSDRTETVRDKVRRTDVDVQKTGGQTTVGAVQWEKVAPTFEKHFKTRYASTGSTFEDYTPAYRYGYNLASDERFQGDWSTVEPEARKHWEKTNKGTWEEFKDSVRHAWESVTGQRS